MMHIPPSESAAMQERRWYFHAYRQAWGKTGSAYRMARREDSDQWFVQCILPDGTPKNLGRAPDFEAALRAVDYCAKHDTLVKIALVHLEQDADPDHLIKLMADAFAMGELPRRRVRMTLEVELDMRGSDEEMRNYILLHLRGASGVSGAAITSTFGPRIEEPRQQP